ncbi:MAG: hypothetical protein JXL97_01095 [Bacteroidales bacterium]|nr:hypothetical protein [Bacteroidales bacterium]
MDEYSFGAKVSTNGWGMDFRRGYSVNLKRKKLYEIGFNTIKHPKEYKFASYYYLTKSFVYGKLNSCMDLKVGYGQQIVLFDKKEVGTVEIRLITFAGLDLAFLKPIYYEIIINSLGDTEMQKYTPAHQPGLIERQAPFSKGLDELTLDPGLYFKLGTSFEHSKNVKSIRSFELGVEATLFLKRLEIMAELNNPRLVVSLFVSYRLGSIIQKKNKEDKFDIGF